MPKKRLTIMANVTIFNSPQFGEIRTAGTSEQPLFCLADVCKALELKTKDVKRRLEDGVVLTHPIVDSLGREQVANFVNEDGLYDVILDSRKKEAKAFRKWITSEVLPSIRKTGGYIAATSDMTDKEIMARALLVANETIKRKDEKIKCLETENKNQQHIITTLADKATYLDQILANKSTILVTSIAQDYGMSAKKFNQLLHQLGIQYNLNKQWILYAPHLTQGYVHSRAIEITHPNGTKTIHHNTEWTQKGRLFLYNTLKKIDIIPLIEKNNS